MKVSATMEKAWGRTMPTKQRKRIHNKLAEKKRWRDGRGIVHLLDATWTQRGIILADPDGVAWQPRCGYRYESTRTVDPETPVTCFACLTGERNPLPVVIPP